MSPEAEQLGPFAVSRRGAKQQAEAASEALPARHALSAHNLAAAAAAAQHSPLDVGSRPQVLLLTSAHVPADTWCFSYRGSPQPILF